VSEHRCTSRHTEVNNGRPSSWICQGYEGHPGLCYALAEEGRRIHRTWDSKDEDRARVADSMDEALTAQAVVAQAMIEDSDDVVVLATLAGNARDVVDRAETRLTELYPEPKAP
jgi:hypothetical protein